GNMHPPEHYINQVGAMEAEESRRGRLSPKEKIAEDGAQLRRQLDQDLTMTLLLQRCQETRFNLLPCDASECLIKPSDRGYQGSTLRHRILTDMSLGDSYHVPCLEAMLDLPQLVPSRFKLDTSPYRWNYNRPWSRGFMIKEWFDRSGQVDLGKLATYFEHMDMYWKERGDWSTRDIEWQIAHYECQTDCGADGWQERPSPPICPNIKSYTAEEGGDGK
ncbi:uncharacterized protein F5Z01DRAFT_595255, partial [Emericellopsis atlantica]